MRPAGEQLLNKVPEVTVYFWIIKVLCTTVGESAADYLNVNLGFGLSGTSVATGLLLVIALVVQVGARRYIPYRYWLTVTLVSVFGTLVTDNLTDNVGLPLEASTLIFSVVLALVFLAWYLGERTLSIHSIVTRGRETFYWLAILVTFALGTATGDLMAEVLGFGYLVSGAIVAVIITVTAVAWRLGLHPILAFWTIYVLTRPLGASIGDYLSQPADVGGLGLGATVTSAIFLVAIFGTVAYLTVTKADVIGASGDVAATAVSEDARRGGLWQTAAVVVLAGVVGGGGYALRTSALQDDSVQQNASTQQSGGSAPSPGQTASKSPLGDLSQFRTITQDTLDKLNAGNQPEATTRVDDLEVTWDHAQAQLRAKDRAAWDAVDGKIDTVLTDLRATNPSPDQEKSALAALLDALG
jgi:uncharacterized membrane-anchored protein